MCSMSTTVHTPHEGQPALCALCTGELNKPNGCKPPRCSLTGCCWVGCQCHLAHLAYGGRFAGC
jgi:hypothetical protein